jgi:hypothetical protein
MMNPKKVWTCLGVQTKVNSKAWANMKCHTKKKSIWKSRVKLGAKEGKTSFIQSQG